MPNDETDNSPGMLFDSVFKTATQKAGHLMVAVIEQMFHVKAELVDLKEIERIANERYLIIDGDTRTTISKRFTDSCFKIGGKYYHIECQSTQDGSILFRLVEYNLRIAIDNARLTDSKSSILVELPSSGLINLRAPSISPKFSQKEIIYRYSDQEIVMPVPVMNIRAFSADEIFSNGLFFLIPFYSIRFENRLKRISRKPSKKLSKKRIEKIKASNKAEYDRIYSELKNCYDRFMKACETKVLSEDDTRNLAELSRIVLNYVTRKLDPDLKGRMVTLLGGQIIELRQDIWFKDGFRQGEKKGEKKYERNHISDMLRRGKTPEEIADFCAYPIDLVKEIQEELLSKVK
ncbi:hypothetical protein SAMN05216349_11324 [Oribacterium sp. KHPX15]|uniref:hypothetical protein n=1 Tax=Oribacterium sp. KHPX15 TaxID=1855342 RepID=UPI0008948DC1|nr:hypothetical protein [Oribacterium sp. KHPX15]SEA45828.1 hypothetical protein SAMN05216349_11324 [Oribacterium sp. KHPX15]